MPNVATLWPAIRRFIFPSSPNQEERRTAWSQVSDPPKVATSKVISLLARNNGNYLSWSEIYLVTVIMIFGKPLCNSKGTLHLFFFFSKSLHFVCECPHRNQTILSKIYFKRNNMKYVSPNKKCGFVRPMYDTRFKRPPASSDPPKVAIEKGCQIRK